jgi:hypothetical protein
MTADLLVSIVPPEKLTRNSERDRPGSVKAGSAVGQVEIVVRAGISKSETLKALDLPFYATLGANCRF